MQGVAKASFMAHVLAHEGHEAVVVTAGESIRGTLSEVTPPPIEEQIFPIMAIPRMGYDVIVKEKHQPKGHQRPYKFHK